MDNLVHVSDPGIKAAACLQVLLISFTLSSPEEVGDMAEKVPLQESRVDSWVHISDPGIMEIQIK